jgi:hypothetical protein
MQVHARVHGVNGGAAMLDPQRKQLARPTADVIRLDLAPNHDRSVVGRWFAALLRALHESRRVQGEREIRRYRHLICYTDTHPDLKILRRCRPEKKVG